MKTTEKLKGLREMVFFQSNEHCFIEKERYLQETYFPEEKPYNFYPLVLKGLLETVSTPVDEKDIFVGRVVEALPDKGMKAPSRLFLAKGHLTPDYEKLLNIGYHGVLLEIKENAKKLATTKAYQYAENAAICIEAIKNFSLRYAHAAKEAGNLRAYKALLRVPYEPAYDLYSALQSIWLVHMISSCYVGYRDYGFGYMDEYLFPFYIKEKEKGISDREIDETLAGFFIKANEICGRATHNYKQKPVLCQASKQYVLLDGGRANLLSERILSAAAINCMAQPEITVVLTNSSSAEFKKTVFETMSVMTDKLQVYNGDILKEFLRNKGLPEEIAEHPAFTACCTADIYKHSCREEFYLPSVQIFCKVLFENRFSNKEDFLGAYSKAITKACEDDILATRNPDKDWTRCVYVLDCLLLGTCNEKCHYPPQALKYRAKNIFLTGLATLGDSLAALDLMVFAGDMDYDTFVTAVKNDFKDEDKLLDTVINITKFGNDNDIDDYTALIAEVLIDAVEKAEHLDNEILLPSFYSLQRENEWAAETPATPNGKRAGTAFSENQSPTYGADTNGVTALLNSLAKIPFYKTAAGGLNLTFSSKIEPDILRALVETYFEKGGLHVGITVLDRNTLLDATKHPEKYPTLTVRLYGFSEYFISLPVWQQEAVLARTAY